MRSESPPSHAGSSASPDWPSSSASQMTPRVLRASNRTQIPSALDPLLISPPPATIDADLQKGSSAHRLMVFWSSLALFIAVVSMSATGPLFLYLQTRGLQPILACAWRNQTMLIFLLPPAIWEWRQLPKNKRTWEAMRVTEDDAFAGSGKSHSSPKASASPPQASRGGKSTRDTMAAREGALYAFPSPTHAINSVSRLKSKDWHVSWYLFAVSLTWAGSLVLWVVALPYTSTPRASLFCSTYPLLLVPYMRYVQKVPVSLGETLGVLVAFFGIVVSEMDSLVGGSDAAPDGMVSVQLSARQQEGYLASSAIGVSPLPGSDWTFAQRQLYGDMLCIGASLLLGLNILFAEKTRRVLPLFTYSASTAFFVLVMLLFGSFALEGSTFTFEPMTGLFGWATRDWFWLLLAFGFIVGCIGVLGFNFAVKYVPSLTFGCVQLLDPGLTAVISWCAGLEAFPPLSSLVGISIVLLGIAMITVYEHRRSTNQQRAEEAKGTAGKKPQFAGLMSPRGYVLKTPRMPMAGVATPISQV